MFFSKKRPGERKEGRKLKIQKDKKKKKQKKEKKKIGKSRRRSKLITALHLYLSFAYARSPDFADEAPSM